MTPDVAVLREPRPPAGDGTRTRSTRGAGRAGGPADRTVRSLDAHTVDEALAACRAAVADGAGALVAVGGDGTVHLALQAVAGTGVAVRRDPGRHRQRLRHRGRPAGRPGRGRGDADRRRRWPRAAPAPVDLAQLTGAGRVRALVRAPCSGPASTRSSTSGPTRCAGPRGRRRYDLAIFAELLRLRPRRYRITLDGETRELDAVLVAVGNTASYGGGMRMCPAADPTDGLLDVVVAGPISRTHAAAPAAQASTRAPTWTTRR